ncbi:GNAT family N-acetyltransferase [Tenacibaculum sp. 47A_GOM-205m]|uniref:GNAT family N-acetyltransferase n=1 Tax=Tenacibaculum sp. 47A_GOM-205m TaxID=1380384 RepID=UPI00048F0BF3|nr:GNAT family N-acetyltransferase [Tenacibaculum sp. 47A_GOM-205m]
MIKISNYLQIKEIQVTDFKILGALMNDVYKDAYRDFWKDGGDWYVQSQFSKTNLEKELSEENTSYYFIQYKNEIVGVFRILWNKNLKGFEEKKSLKLHRIYLHKKTQGKGIGKQLLAWLEEEAIKKQYELIWLDTMDEKPQAFEFYKKVGYQYHSHCFLDFELLFDEKRKMSQVFKTF